MPLVCPWCMIQDVRFETLVPGQVVSSGPHDPQNPEYMKPPYFRYSCAVCRYSENHVAMLYFSSGA